MAITDTTQSNPEATVVRLRNDGDTLFRARYGGIRYHIEPGSEAIVPFMAMCLWFGHPNAVDIDKRRRYRTWEFQRLCVKYGVYEHHELINEMFPKVSAWDLLSNTEYITVVKDPDGKHLTPDVQTKLERESLVEQMNAMQRQIAELHALLDQNDKQTAADIISGDVRTDTPTHRPELQVSPDITTEPVADGGATIDRPTTPKPVPHR